MKTILEYLLGKNKNIYVGFPDKPDKDEIVGFLKSQGFENVSDPDHTTYGDMAMYIINSDGPAYVVGEYKPTNEWSEYIMFGDGTNTEHKMFFIRTSEKLINKHESSCFMYWREGYRALSESNSVKLSSYKDLLTEINKCYGW